MSDAIILNVPPELATFAEALKAPKRLVIRFPGGMVFEPQVDPTRAPGACQQTLDLLGKLQGAMAPFMPVLKILDAVASLGQCLLLVKDAISNPFKIPDLVACLPTLVQKLLALLALIPIFPTGIAAYVTFVYDVLVFAAAMIDCVIQQLGALQKELAEIGRLIETANRAEDPEVRRNLEQMIEIATSDVTTSSGQILEALGPIARLLCTVRQLLALIPGGREIAEKMRFPNPTNVRELADAVNALSSIRDTLLSVTGLLEALGNPFGAFGDPGIGFDCPLDTGGGETGGEELPILTPRISTVTNDGGLLLLSISAASEPTDPSVPLLVHGSGYSATSQLYWNAAQIQDVTFVSPSTLRAVIPAEVLTNKGKFYLLVANLPAEASAFSGLSSTPGSGGDSNAKTSNQYQLEVS